MAPGVSPAELLQQYRGVDRYTLCLLKKRQINIRKYHIIMAEYAVSTACWSCIRGVLAHRVVEEFPGWIWSFCRHSVTLKPRLRPRLTGVGVERELGQHCEARSTCGYLRGMVWPSVSCVHSVHPKGLLGPAEHPHSWTGSVWPYLGPLQFCPILRKPMVTVPSWWGVSMTGLEVSTWPSLGGGSQVRPMSTSGYLRAPRVASRLLFQG